MQELCSLIVLHRVFFFLKNLLSKEQNLDVKNRVSTYFTLE